MKTETTEIQVDFTCYFNKFVDKTVPHPAITISPLLPSNSIHRHQTDFEQKAKNRRKKKNTETIEIYWPKNTRPRVDFTCYF